MSAAKAWDWARGLGADLVIRAATAAVVLAVAGFAAVVSYSHIYTLARDHGQAGTAARLLPLSVDGLIVAASLVMLHAARTGGPVLLARAMLGLGVAATVGANVLYGLAFGVLGAVISAWPAVAFIGAAEMGLGMVRASAVPDAPAAGAGVPEHLAAAVREFAAEIGAGVVPPIRRIREALSVGQARATEVQAYLGALAGEVLSS